MHPIGDADDGRANLDEDEKLAAAAFDDPIEHARLWLQEHGVEAPSLEPLTDGRARDRSWLAGGEGPAGDSGDRPEPPYGRGQGKSATASQNLRVAELKVTHDEATEAAFSAIDRRNGGPDHELDADPVQVARSIVLRKLAAQARTRQELRKALDARDVPAAVSDSVLDRMEAVGLVNDAVFSSDWVNSRQQRRHLSKRALHRELSSKGVDREHIEAALSGVDEEDELGAARQLAETKLRAMVGLDRQVQFRRLSGALGRRGFSGGVVNRVLSEVLS